MIQRILVRGGAALVVAMVLLVGAGWAMAKPRPDTGTTGPAASALVARVHQAVRLERWAETNAVAWTFSGSNEHLWDRERGLSRVRWGKVEVLQRTDKRVGRVFKGGEEVHGAQRDKLVAKAWSMFINDSFWLQPFANLDDTDVTRSVVDWDGREAL